MHAPDCPDYNFVSVVKNVCIKKPLTTNYTRFKYITFKESLCVGNKTSKCTGRKQTINTIF